MEVEAEADKTEEKQEPKVVKVKEKKVEKPKEKKNGYFQSFKNLVKEFI